VKMVARITTHKTFYGSASKTLDLYNWQPRLQPWMKNYSSLLQLSEYVSRAEIADSKIRERTGERVHISAVADMVEMESENDISSQDSTLPDELDEDDERQYQMEEEWDEERAEHGDPSYRVR